MDWPTLSAAWERGDRWPLLMFWGARPASDGGVGPGCLSQWWGAPFEVDGARYATAEHWMMAGKARLFGDASVLEQLLASADPREAKALGRQVRGFDEGAWKAHRSEIVVEGNVAKFSQNAAERAFLLGTEPAVLVEASPRDRIWGIGLGEANPRAHDPRTWRGQNLLGFALMEVRRRLAEG